MMSSSRLEIVCGLIPHPGFKSQTLRHASIRKDAGFLYFTNILVRNCDKIPVSIVLLV